MKGANTDLHGIHFYTHIMRGLFHKHLKRSLYIKQPVSHGSSIFPMVFL